MNVAYNLDCMEAMKHMPDNAFELAIVDRKSGSNFFEPLRVSNNV